MRQLASHADPMSQAAPHISYFRLLIGALAGTAIILVAYVAQLNSSVVAPHMAAERFYYFIPGFALFAFLLGAMTEIAVFQSIGWHVRAGVGWILLGVAYSAVFLPYNLAPFIDSKLLLWAVTLAFATGSIILLHRIFAISNSRAGA